MSPAAAVPADPGWVAGEIAQRVCDPRAMARAAEAHTRPSRQASLLAWRPASLAQGHAGLAVLCAALDAAQPEKGWDRIGHQQLAAAAARVGRGDGSLFSGLAGLGFAATLLAARRPRYERLLAQVDQSLAPLLETGLDRLATASGCRVSDFDVVSGLTGAGVYLLSRVQAGPYAAGRGAGEASASENPAALLTRLLAALAQLTADSGHPRRWHTPAELTPEPMRRQFPRGVHNCGLAHGLPGPLALLSLALLAQVRAPGAEEAIHTAAEWLARHQTGTEQEPDWPDGVALDAVTEPSAAWEHTPGRAAWCYGAPGVARSLWLAGRATGNAQWQDLAVRTIRAVAARPSPAWYLTTPGFCHGQAGLLRVLRRFAVDLADPAIAAAADRLTAEIAARFEPDSLFGVRSIDADGVPVDQAGLLDGAAGVALALLGPPAPESAPLAAPAWDRMFLLA